MFDIIRIHLLLASLMVIVWLNAKGIWRIFQPNGTMLLLGVPLAFRIKQIIGRVGGDFNYV